MITTILVDFSRTLLFPRDKAYDGKLNPLYKTIVLNKTYDFFEYFYLNAELIGYLQSLRKKYRLYVFITDIIQNDPAIKPILYKNFSKVFAANDLGINKKDSSGYIKLAQILNEKPEHVLLIDDTKEKLEAAKEAGFQTIKFISNKQIFEALNNTL